MGRLRVGRRAKLVEHAGGGNHTAQARQGLQVPTVVDRTDQEKNIGQHPSTAAEGYSRRRQAQGDQRLAEDAGHGSSRVQQGHAVFQGGRVHFFARQDRFSHLLGVPQEAGLGNHLDHAANYRTLRPRRQRHGNRLSQQQFAHGNFRIIAGCVRSAQNALDLKQFAFVGKPDAVLEPMVDIGPGKTPTPAHLAAGQSITIGQA